MASYWRLTGSPNDLALLPEPHRTASDLVRVATAVEQDILDLFTRYVGAATSRLTPSSDEATYTAIGSDLGVFLRGYTVDANDPAVDQTFAAAFRRTIARVIEWRLDGASTNARTISEGAKASSRTYRVGAREPFPDGWDLALLPFSTLPPAWRT